MNKNSPLRTLKLPTGKVKILLDRLGLEKTWKSLIVTHIFVSHPHFTDISSSPEFAGAETLSEDLLEDLSIGQTSILYEYSLAHIDKDSRREAGQYFTPDDVSLFLASKSRQFKPGVWLDPCSGIGNLSYWLAFQQDNPEDFLLHHLKLVDRDPLALLIARALFTIRFQREENGLFAKIKDNFVRLDFLETSAIPDHDYAILNPPYNAGIEDNTFRTGKARDTYSYFLERVINSSTGFISITPQSFTHAGKFSELRAMLLETYQNLDIYCFDNIPDSIFKGVKFGSVNTNKVNSTRAAVIVAQQGKGHGYRITPMLRWLTSQRTEMLSRADEFLGVFIPSTKMFLKVGAGLAGLQKELLGKATLRDYTSKTPTPYSLTIPSTPRYFTPAVKRNLSRSPTGYRMLYFHSAADRDKFYVYLNSSLFYWWWRANDDGLKISAGTLDTVPVMDGLTSHPDLVEKLEESERVNLVNKVNSGRANENVKHSVSLIQEINDRICPVYQDSLFLTHRNTYL